MFAQTGMGDTDIGGHHLFDLYIMFVQTGMGDTDEGGHHLFNLYIMFVQTGMGDTDEGGHHLFDLYIMFVQTGMGDTDMGSHHLFVPLVTSPGAIHFYRQEDQPVGSDLLTVILQGWPMLILILLGASYSGIIIWLLVRTL